MIKTHTNVQKKDGIQEMGINYIKINPRKYYISLEAIKNHLEQYKEFGDRINEIINEFYEYTVEHGINLVQCQNCKYSDKYCQCEFMNLWTTGKDFCSRGIEKKGE